MSMQRTPNIGGQGMVEAIIAIGILATATASALTLTSAAINAGKRSENLLVAGNLAREAVEVARLIRDSNWLSGAAWDAGLYGPPSDYTAAPVFNPVTNSWSMNFATNALGQGASAVYRYTAASGTAAEGLMVQGAGASATQPAGTVVSPYYRYVLLEPMCDNGAGGYSFVTSGSTCGANPKIGIRVRAQVRWFAGTTARYVTVEERLFNWR